MNVDPLSSKPPLLHKEEVKKPIEPLSTMEKIIGVACFIFAAIFTVLEWGGPFTVATIASNIVPPVFISALVVGTFFYCYYMITRTEEPRRAEDERKKNQKEFSEKLYEKLWEKSNLEEKLNLQELARTHKMNDFLLTGKIPS